MTEQWYYANAGQTYGPVDMAGLTELARRGAILPDTLVWRDGLEAWAPAAEATQLFAAAPPPLPLPGDVGPPPVPGPADAAAPPVKDRGLLGGIGARISKVSDLPTLSNVPVGEILMGGLSKKTAAEDIEDEFIVGTRTTTPALSAIDSDWPKPRVFWRVLGGALATYLLLWLGVAQFRNINFVPGMLVIGSFIVPFAVVVLFFELNVPRNVSIYQVGKMLMIGGATSLITTMFLFTTIPGSGVGALVPALLTGVIEETGKALVLLLLVSSPRYPWQLNGLLFGAAVGAGFAGFESAGYAFRAILSEGGLSAALSIIMWRGLLSPGGHVIWTAMVGSAIWKAKADQGFSISVLFQPVVLRRWLIAVVLHGLWDANLLIHPYVKLGVLVVVGWYIVLAILKQALSEVRTRKAAG